MKNGMGIINNKKDRLILYFCMGAVIISYIIISLLYCYEDTEAFSTWSFEFWDAVFGKTGNGHNIYSVFVENARNTGAGAPEGSYLTFLPWIIWSLPMYGIRALIDPQVTPLGNVEFMWMKAFLLLCLAFLCIFVYKCIIVLKPENKSKAIWASVFMAGGMELLCSIGYAGQDEIVYLVFLVGALYYRLRGKKVIYMIFAVIATTICPMVIVPIMIGGLVWDKNVIRIILKGIVYALPTVLFEIVYRGDLNYQIRKGVNGINLLQRLFLTGKIDTTLGMTSIAFTFIVLLAVVAYFHKRNKEDENLFVIWCYAFCFFAFCFLTYSIWYRYCLYLPFFVIMIACSGNFENNLFLTMLLSLMRSTFLYANDYDYNNRYLSALGDKLFPNHGAGTMIPIASSMYQTLMMIETPIVLGIGIYIIYGCFKKRQEHGVVLLRESSIVLIHSVICLLWSLAVIGINIVGIAF